MSEEQNVTVGILEFESTQSVMCIFEWLGKLDSARRKFRSQRVRIGNINISVPWRAAQAYVPRVIRHRLGADCLEKDHRPAALHDSEKKVVGLSLKCDLKPELVAIKRKRSCNIFHDKTRRYPADLWLSHILVVPSVVDGLFVRDKVLHCLDLREGVADPIEVFADDP